MNHKTIMSLPQCGLPILYRESGGIPEYCRNYGVSFDDDLVTSLSEIISNYEIYKNEILNYPNNSFNYVICSF